MSSTKHEHETRNPYYQIQYDAILSTAARRTFLTGGAPINYDRRRRRHHAKTGCGGVTWQTIYLVEELKKNQTNPSD